MTFQKILIMISQRAGLLTKDWQNNLKKGEIKETIKYCGIHLFENPGMPEESFLDAVSLTIHDKWLKEYGINISVQTIAKVLKSARIPS